MTSTTACPNCGQPADGKFCSHCGSPLGDAVCPKCNAALTAGARFCHVCGTPFGGERKRLPALPVALAALATVIIIVAVAYVVGRSSAAPAPAAGGQSAPFAAGPGGGAPPDISNLTPREQADRLFNLIMSAHEQGDAGRIAMFKPMAVQAYQMLGDLDNDAHYHVGLIHAVTGDAEQALAQADSIQETEPNHLLAIMLRNSVAQLQGDQAAAQASYDRFLAHYDEEIATEKLEYQDHRRAIDNFREQARSATGAPQIGP